MLKKLIFYIIIISANLTIIACSKSFLNSNNLRKNFDCIPNFPIPYTPDFEESLVFGYIRSSNKKIYNDDYPITRFPFYIKKLVQKYYRQPIKEGSKEYYTKREEWLQLSLNKQTTIFDIKLFLSSYGLDINCIQKNRNNILYYYLFKNQNIPIILYLIEKLKIDVEKQNVFGDTVLHFAAIHDLPEVVKSLLNFTSIDVNKRNNLDKTALHFAIENNSIKAARALLSSNKIDFSIKNCESHTPLFQCLYYVNDRVDILNLIMEKETNINRRGKFGNTIAHQMILSKCANYDDYVMEMVLKNKRLNPNAQNNLGKTILHCLIYKNDIDILKFFLKQKYFEKLDPNITNLKGYNPLHFAMEKKNLEIIKIISSIPDLDLNHYSLITMSNLQYSIIEGDHEILDNMLNNSKLQINYKGRYGITALHQALKKKDESIITKLLKIPGINFAAKTEVGFTPLHTAIENDISINIFNMLLLCARDSVNEQDFNGNTPLHYAIINKKIPIIKSLLRLENINVNIRNHHLNQTPLTLALEKRDLNTIKAMLESYKFDLSIRDTKKNTPLHTAVLMRRLDIVHELLKEGADPNLYNGDNLTPLYLAAKYRYRDIMLKILLSSDVNPYLSNNKTDETIFHFFIENYFNNVVEGSNIKYLKLLIGSYNINIQAKENYISPLIFAIQKGAFNALKALLELDYVDINKKEHYINTTLLHEACKLDNIDIIEEILDFKKNNVSKQAKFDIYDGNGNTPLIAAIYKKNTKVVKFLLSNYNPLINKTDEKGESPLFIAIQQKALNIVKVIIEDYRLDEESAARSLYYFALRGDISFFKHVLKYNPCLFEREIRWWEQLLSKHLNTKVYGGTKICYIYNHIIEGLVRKIIEYKKNSNLTLENFYDIINII